MQYSNPRLEATFEDWPSGRYTTTAVFRVETHPKRGQRATRVTLHPVTRRPSQPKCLTYAPHVRIVDGSDGRTYIAELHGGLFGIRIMRGTMDYQHEILYPGQPGYDAVRAMFP